MSLMLFSEFMFSCLLIVQLTSRKLTDCRPWQRASARATYEDIVEVQNAVLLLRQYSKPLSVERKANSLFIYLFFWFNTSA